jgi:uncharacterized protein (TIGR04255 family)
MSETFRNAPLVEIVVELRWPMRQLPAIDSSGNATSLFVTPLDNAVEAFFHRVTGAVGKHGFTHLERLVPPEVPVLLPQMIYRDRRSDEEPVLTQVGPGLFSVNALPPYRSWVQFRPWLDKGIEAVLDAFEEKPELTASLRYIDAFRQNLTGGRDARTFATEVLGFRLELPPSLSRVVDKGAAARAAFQVTLPTSGMLATITLSDGQLAGEQAVLMNTDIHIDRPLPPNKEEILAALDRARDLVHGTFVDMTQSIRTELQPVPLGDQ